MVSLSIAPASEIRHTRLLWGCAWLLCFCAFATVAAQPLTNIDIAWHLLASREWARGAQLYTEIRDPNLPATWILYRAVWWLSDLSGLPAHRVLFTLVALWGLACTALSVRLLPPDRGWSRPATVLGIGLFFAAASLYQAGQRDYIISLSLLPYAAWIHRLSVDPKPSLRGLGALVTACALIATLLKPYALASMLLVELWLAWRRRSAFTWLRADLLGPALLLALLTVLQLVAFPAYLQFLDDWGRYYAAQGATVLTARVWLTIALVAAAVLWLWLPPRPQGWGRTLVVLAIGSLLTCALQNKWWDYHAYQFELLVELAWFVLLAEAWQAGRRRPAGLAGVARVVLALLVVAWFGWIAVLAAKQQKLMTIDGVRQEALVALRDAIDSQASGRYVAFFGGMNCQISVYYSRARWGLTGHTLWVDGHLEKSLRENLPRPEWLVDAAQRHYADVLQRLQRDRPVLIGFYTGSVEAPEDFLAVYRGDRAIRELLDGEYRYWQDIAQYRLYLRADR